MKASKAQVSLEYLIVFAVSISILLSILPILSRARELSVNSVKSNYVDYIIRDLSTGCEEVLITGGIVKINLDRDIDLSTHENELKVSFGDINSSLNWNNECDLHKKDESVLVKRTN